MLFCGICDIVGKRKIYSNQERDRKDFYYRPAEIGYIRVKEGDNGR